ncbi:MAG: hypothetical protein ACOYOE_01710 [Chlorobium sp.]
MNVYFTDYFGVPMDTLEKYGAFNISLINDLPVFIDPFLLFNSDKPAYMALHDSIIKYLTFLRDMSDGGPINAGLLNHWFLFPEVKQNWLGYSKVGNRGAGLGRDFAAALNDNLSSIFKNFGAEQITKGSHLEKLCLVKDGVGKDSISDFTTNLIKGYLCEYTQTFAINHINPSFIKRVEVRHASFDYMMRRWNSKYYSLPYIDGDYVLLSPKDILTKDETWINKHDIIGYFNDIIAAIPNEELRGQINDFYLRLIPANPKRRDLDEAASRAVRKYPELIDYYIRYKEDNGEKAIAISDQKVKETEIIFIEHVRSLIDQLKTSSEFYYERGNTFDEAIKRVYFLKQVIENNNGYRIFYVEGIPVKREQDLQLIFRLTWYASTDDVNAEVNNGRGPVDYKISRGADDSTLVEFKLASNSKLKQNLENQVAVYETANKTKKSIKVILFFSDAELAKVIRIISDLGLREGPELVLIDARSTNKTSASNVK